MRKEPETIVFQALGSFESKTVWGTVLALAWKLKSEGLKTKSWNFAEVRLRPYSPKES